LIDCYCMYEHLGYSIDTDKTFNNLPENVYRYGVSDEEELHWVQILSARGRIPFIHYPTFCAKCGTIMTGDSTSWEVQDEEWNHYIEPQMRGCVLCRSCYDLIKKAIDQVQGNIKEGNVMIDKSNQEAKLTEKEQFITDFWNQRLKLGLKCMVNVSLSAAYKAEFNEDLELAKSLEILKKILPLDRKRIRL